MAFGWLVPKKQYMKSFIFKLYMYLSSLPNFLCQIGQRLDISIKETSLETNNTLLISSIIRDKATKVSSRHSLREPASNGCFGCLTMAGDCKIESFTRIICWAVSCPASISGWRCIPVRLCDYIKFEHIS